MSPLALIWWPADVGVDSLPHFYHFDPVSGLMDGWMDGRTDGWVDGRMDEWTDGWTDGWTGGWPPHDPHGLAVRIPGSHPGGPSLIPGMGTLYHLIFLPYMVSTNFRQRSCEAVMKQQGSLYNTRKPLAQFQKTSGTCDPSGTLFRVLLHQSGSCWNTFAAMFADVKNSSSFSCIITNKSAAGPRTADWGSALSEEEFVWAFKMGTKLSPKYDLRNAWMVHTPQVTGGGN